MGAWDLCKVFVGVRFSHPPPKINSCMKINVFINDKLYKTLAVQGDSYNPMSIYPQIEADKQSGLLHTYNISEQLKIRVEKVKN